MESFPVDVDIEAVDIPLTINASKELKSGSSYLNNSTLSTNISVSVVDTSSIIFAVGKISDSIESLALETNSPLMFLSTFCFVQLNGL